MSLLLRQSMCRLMSAASVVALCGCYLSHERPSEPEVRAPEPTAVAGFSPFACESSGHLRYTQTTPPSVSFVGSVWMGDHLLATNRWGLIVLSRDGEIVSRVATPGESWNVAADGTTAYVTDRAGLLAVDLTDPTHPRVLDHLRTDVVAGPNDVAIRDGLAFLADRDRVTVVDVSDPSDLREVEVVPLDDVEDSRAMSILLGPAHLYVAVQAHGVVVLSLEPGLPFVARIDTPGWASDLAWASDGILAIADRDEGLQLADVSDPTRPRLRGSAPTEGNAWGVASAGPYVALTDSAGRDLTLYDVSDPDRPRRASSYASRFDDAEAIAVSFANGVVALSTFGGGLELLELEDGGSTHLLTQIDGPDLRVFGFHVDPSSLTVGRRDGVQRYRLDDRPVLDEVARVDTPTPVFSIAGRGAVIYAGTESGRIDIIDFTVPERPRVLAPLELDSTRRVAALAVSADVLFVGEQDTGRGDGVLSAFSIADPTRPEALWRMPLRGGPGTLRPHGAQIAVAELFTGASLSTWDMSGLSAPRLFEIDPFDVALRPDEIWIAGRERGLFRMDANDSTAPPLAHLDLNTSGLYALDDTVAATTEDGPGALTLFDLDAVDWEHTDERCDTPGLADRVFLTEDRAFVGDWFAVSIYQR